MTLPELFCPEPVIKCSGYSQLEIAERILGTEHFTGLLDFLKLVERSTFDVIVFMARKGYSTFRALESGIPPLRRAHIVITHNALPFFGKRLKGKRVLIVDDIIIVGNAVSKTVETLKNCGVEAENISIAAYCVCRDILDNDRLRILPKLYNKPRALKKAALLRLSSLLAWMIHSSGTPFVAYTPVFTAQKSDGLFNSCPDGWKLRDVKNYTGDSLRACGVEVAYFSADMSEFGMAAGVRVYISQLRTLIIPIVFLPAMTEHEINLRYLNLLDKLGYTGLEASDMTDPVARYRFLHWYYCYVILARFEAQFNTGSLTPYEFAMEDAFSDHAFPELDKKIRDYITREDNIPKWNRPNTPLSCSETELKERLFNKIAKMEYNHDITVKRRGVSLEDLQDELKIYAADFFWALMSVLDSGQAGMRPYPVETDTDGIVVQNYIYEGEQNYEYFAQDVPGLAYALPYLFEQLDSSYKTHREYLTDISEKYLNKLGISPHIVSDFTGRNDFKDLGVVRFSDMLKSDTEADRFFVGLAQAYPLFAESDQQDFVCFVSDLPYTPFIDALKNGMAALRS